MIRRKIQFLVFDRAYRKKTLTINSAKGARVFGKEAPAFNISFLNGGGAPDVLCTHSFFFFFLVHLISLCFNKTMK